MAGDAPDVNYANALDGFKDSDVMYDARSTIAQVSKRANSLEKMLLDAFESGWNAHIDAAADAARNAK